MFSQHDLQAPRAQWLSMMTTNPNKPGPAKGKRRGRSIALIVVAVLFVGIAAVGIGSEFYLRNRVSDCMAQSLSQSVGSDVAVSMSRKPMLMQMVDGKTPWVEVTSMGDRLGDADGMHMDLRLEGVHSFDDGEIATTVERSTADITWSAPGILATLQRQGVLAVVTAVEPRPADQTLGIQIVGAILSVTVAPSVQNEAINLEVTDANLLGIGIPRELPQAIIQTIGDGLSEFPLDMKPTNLTVTGEGIELRLEGGYTEMERAEMTGEEVTCSLF
ncbi:DUF2993 domain-containing protein [Hoyosella sp. YIM 151337]|uniref:LmeA family phospholipid-binding protein n=1 Tax=Hoyosella sp. YIM 151337 TaxID=2992742 RepID=UPI002235A402|nr:DUF2993 domain-containing protein [Hoyosella sp. YIM 151337]MCW4353333.1 DUF2993 domain-containing protein [Hoyosella sp. YIM 151337]